jgi:hypothetical protein
MSRLSRRPHAVPQRPQARPAAGPIAEPPAWLVWLAPLLAAALVHGNALTGFFAADDLDFLARARGLDATPWGWARPLPGRLRWELFTSWFGVEPFPHLLLAWLLHAVSALLVARIAVRAGLGRWAAIAAAVLVAASSIAYASTHWASGLGEVMAATFALGTLALHLECRHRAHPALAWLAGTSAVCAVLSKESVLLLPLAVFAFDRMVPVRGPGRGALREVAWLGGLAGVAVVAGWFLRPNVAGEAYALSPSPAAWVTNLCTYGAWLVRLGDPIRDRAAVAAPALVPWGLALFAAWVLAAWSERAKWSRPMSAGLAWFTFLLAPVVPLASHSYLYYLLAPLAGFAIAAGVLLVDLATRVPRANAAAVIGVVLVAYAGNEAYQVRVRQTLVREGIVVDRVARESALLRLSLAGLRAAHVAAGDTIVFVNPDPARSVDATHGVVRPAGSGFGENAYIPFVSAWRGGSALPLFLPGVTVLGMGDGVPPAWERARVFRFDNDGRLHDLGRGDMALDSLASDYLMGARWLDARTALERLLQLGRDGPEVRWRLGSALAHLGDDAGAFAQARLLLSRWPDSPRARQLRENSARVGSPGAPPAH